MKQVKQRIVPLTDAIRLKVIFAVMGSVSAVSAIAFVVHWKSVATSPNQPSASVQGDGPSVDQADDRANSNEANESPAIQEIPLGRVFGINNPAPPPIVQYVGRQPDQADTPDLSTPAAAVQAVLSLIDQSAMDKLALCFYEEPNGLASNLYPGYVGQPIGLVEVTEDGDFADVIWEATVHTAFSRHGRHWSPEEVITLSARLVRVEGLWKLLELHKGEKDGDPQETVSTN